MGSFIRGFRSGLGLRALLVVMATAGVACDFGSGSSGGGGGDHGGGQSPTAASATLAWAPAPGPVAGYAVYVQRNGGAVKREKDVSTASAKLSGVEGEYARVAVAAFTSTGLMGPLSPLSDTFYFGSPESAGAQAASTLATQAGVASLGLPAPGTRSLAPVEPAPGDAEPEPDERTALQAADLAAGLVWLAEGAVRVTDAALATRLLFSAPAGSTLVGADDFDGDGAPELLWAEGELLSTTPLLGPDVGRRVGFAVLEPGERVAGVGDLDGDGRADLVLLGADGAVRSWLSVLGTASEPLGQVGDAALMAVADFDGDGAEDLAWREADGSGSLWLMDGNRLHGSFAVALGAQLTPAGAGDFDGDGEAELALRDGSGGLHVSEPLDGTLRAAGAADARLWRPVGVGDLDSDGRDELVFAGDGALLVARLPGERTLPLEAGSPWQLAALLP